MICCNKIANTSYFIPVLFQSWCQFSYYTVHFFFFCPLSQFALMEGSTMLSYLEPPALHSCCASSRLCATICRLTTCSAASRSAHSPLTHTTPTTGASQVREGVREHERERENCVIDSIMLCSFRQFSN